MACGDSYTRRITVTGALPGKDWGGQYTATLEPLVTPWEFGQADLSHDSANERALVEDLRAVLGSIRADVMSEATLRHKDRTQLLALLNSGDVQLDDLPGIYEHWLKFLCIRGLPEAGVCPWPLDWGDGPQDWFFECDKPHPGVTFVGADGNARTCPPPSIELDRTDARDTIRDRVDAAFGFARCAQYWLAKWRLWGQALSTYVPVSDPTSTWGQRTDPKPTPVQAVPGPGGLLYQPPPSVDPRPSGPFVPLPQPDPDPDPTFPGFPLPDPDLAPAPEPGDRPPEGEDETGSGPIPPEGESETLSSGAGVVALAVGGVLLVLALRK